jgi:putative membrane protein
MILPGLSGSFVLFLMGNYQLVVIDAVNNRNLQILLPVALGAFGGLIAFSHLLSWVFKRFRCQTISLLTGFILGSVSILWPWQNPVYMTDETGNLVLIDGETIVMQYERYIPESFSTEVVFAILIALAGVLSILAIERTAMMKTGQTK